MAKNKVSVYDFTLTDHLGHRFKLKELKGKVILVVNTALHCSFSEQYKDLNDTYRKFHSEGFEILDFPSNDFHGQTPENDEEISSYLENTYHPEFRRMKKESVLEDSFFTFLCQKKKFLGFPYTTPLAGVIASIHIKEGPGWEEKPTVKWNFTKFLIDRKGKVSNRFECTAPYGEVDSAIEHILDKQLEEEYETDR